LGVGKKIWECSKRHTSLKCHARLHTTDSPNPTLIEEIGTHEHRANAIAVEVKQAMSSIRQQASTSSDTPSKIISSNVTSLSSAAQGALPLLHNLKRGIRKMRHASGGSLAVPHRREDINLPEEFTTTVNGDNFLLFDSGPNSDRILIFGTTDHLNFLKHSDILLADGTFKSSPNLFDQLFIIHGMRGKTTFPLVYCLTPNRTTPTYVRMLTALKNLCPELAPKMIMSDFEKASVNAFQEVFPGSENKGCFFHLSQCFYRHVQKLPEVLHRYSTDSDFCLQLRFLIALAFVPPEDVAATFEHLMRIPFFTDNEELLQEFTTYFESTWIGKMNRAGTQRLSPKFAIELWNCFHSVLEDLPKTNNTCEGYHNGLAACLGAAHPTIYKLIKELQHQHSLSSLKINQFLAGNVQNVCKKTVKLASRLKLIVEGYGVDESATNIFCHTQYLRKLAYCISD